MLWTASLRPRTGRLADPIQPFFLIQERAPSLHGIIPIVVRTRETQKAQKTQKDAETANGLNTDLSIGDPLSTNRRAASRIRAPREVSRTIRFDGITLRDLRNLRDLRRLFGATPMPESVEVLDRPRFQKQTLIAQISQIPQIDSLVVHFASFAVNAVSICSKGLASPTAWATVNSR